MISANDSLNSLDLGNYYAILPNDKDFLDFYLKNRNLARKLPNNFSYSSNNNSQFLSKDEIRKLIVQNHVCWWQKTN